MPVKTSVYELIDANLPAYPQLYRLRHKSSGKLGGCVPSLETIRNSELGYDVIVTNAQTRISNSIIQGEIEISGASKIVSSEIKGFGSLANVTAVDVHIEGHMTIIACKLKKVFIRGSGSICESELVDVAINSQYTVNTSKMRNANIQSDASFVQSSLSARSSLQSRVRNELRVRNSKIGPEMVAFSNTLNAVRVQSDLISETRFDVDIKSEDCVILKSSSPYVAVFYPDSCKLQIGCQCYHISMWIAALDSYLGRRTAGISIEKKTQARVLLGTAYIAIFVKFLQQHPEYETLIQQWYQKSRKRKS